MLETCCHSVSRKIVDPTAPRAFTRNGSAMHFADKPTTTPDKGILIGPPSKTIPAVSWWRELTRYHWFVMVVAALGWLFDTMDQQLFNLTRAPAMQELLQPGMSVAWYGGLATAIFLIGWATGGIAFGILGDRIGRARTMLLTILVYSIFTGLSAFSQNFWDFALYRFLTGLGVGGEFAVGVALVAEVMPDRARPHALGWLQALSAIGNVTAALLNLAFSQRAAEVQQWDLFGQKLTVWRTLFLIGTGPALLAILIRRQLKEPERWRSVAVSQEVHRQLGSLKELFGNPRWRHNALVGFFLAFSGVVGLWGIGFFSFDLLRLIFEPALKVQMQHLDPAAAKAAVEAKLGEWVSWTSVLQNLGGFLGIQGFMWLTQRTTRRRAFCYSFLAALVSTVFTFMFLGKVLGIYDVLWMIPIMGACQLSLFGGYAIYFPELFPTRLRSTGTSFCYNVGRFVAAAGPFTLGLLTSDVFQHTDAPMRYAGMVMCSVFLIGLLALPFAPETKGQPLPE
jgi:MFS family permease